MHLLDPSDRTMALESTQPLTEISTRSISCGKSGRCVRLTNLPPSWATVTSYRSILILSSNQRLGLPSALFPSGFPTCIRLSSHPYALHARPISFFLILSPEKYWVRCTDHKEVFNKGVWVLILCVVLYINELRFGVLGI